MESALPEFLVACKAHGVKKPNPTLVKFFKEEEPIATDIEEIKLEGNYVGNRGIMALLDVVEKKLPNFRTLDLSGQKLYNSDLSEDSIKGNTVVDRVVDVFKTHPSVTSLNISDNPVSNYAGRKFLALVQQNPKMCYLELNNTRVDFDLRKRISTQCEKNTTALWENNEAAATDAAPHEEAGFGAFSDEGASTWTAAAKKAPDLKMLGGGSSRRKTIRAEGVDPEKAKRYVAPVIEKSPEDISMIVGLLQNNVLFSFLIAKDMRTVALAMSRKDFKRGEDIMTQHGIGDALYVLQTGSADILKEGQKVFLKTPGTAVGELELMYDAPCAATVRVCTDEAVTWRLDRDTYRNLVMGTAIRRRDEFAHHLAAIPFLAELSQYEKMQIADALSTDEWAPGDPIIKFDEEGEWMFIILEGTVEVIGRRNGEKTKVCEFTTGDHIGELEFLNNHRTVADVIAVTHVVTAKLNRRHFEMCLGNILEVLKRNTKAEKYEYYNKILAEKKTAPAHE